MHLARCRFEWKGAEDFIEEVQSSKFKVQSYDYLGFLGLAFVPGVIMTHVI
jgi:hypothetical protein